MPSNHRALTPRGARLTRAAARVTRSGSRAAQASACGPPPERPSTANCSSPNSSATAFTSRRHRPPCAPPPVRAAVPGPVEADQPDLGLVSSYPLAAARPCCPECRGGRTRVPPWVAGHAHGQPPTVGQVRLVSGDRGVICGHGHGPPHNRHKPHKSTVKTPHPTRDRARETGDGPRIRLVIRWPFRCIFGDMPACCVSYSRGGSEVGSGQRPFNLI